MTPDLQSLLLQAASAQYVITGSWYGRGESKAGLTYNTYLCELILLKKGNNITGTLNYFFGQHEYSTKVTGVYWPESGTIEYGVVQGKTRTSILDGAYFGCDIGPDFSCKNQGNNRWGKF